MAGVKEPLCVNFVKTKCPFCKIGDRIINRGFLKNYLRLDYNFIVVNIKKYYGATKIWWGKVSPNMLGVDSTATPSWVFFELDKNIFAKPKKIFILSSKTTGYRIRNLRDQVLALKDSMEEWLWETYPEYMSMKSELMHIGEEEYLYVI